jgi:hypothetical protein
MSVDRSKTVSTALMSAVSSSDVSPSTEAAVGGGVGEKSERAGCGIVDGLGGGGGDTNDCARDAADSGMTDGGGDWDCDSGTSDGV